MTICFAWFAKHDGQLGYILASEFVVGNTGVDGFARMLAEQGFTDVQLLYEDDGELDCGQILEILEKADALASQPALWSGSWLPVYPWQRGESSTITKQAARRMSELVDKVITEGLSLTDPRVPAVFQEIMRQVEVEFPDADMQQVGAILVLGCDRETRPV